MAERCSRQFTFNVVYQKCALRVLLKSVFMPPKLEGSTNLFIHKSIQTAEFSMPRQPDHRKRPHPNTELNLAARGEAIVPLNHLHGLPGGRQYTNGVWPFMEAKHNFTGRRH